MKSMKSYIFLLLFLVLPSLAYGTTYHCVYPGLGTGNNDGSYDGDFDDAWRSFANVNWSTLESEAASQPVYLYVKKGTTTTVQVEFDGSGSSSTNRIYITTDPADSGADPIIQSVAGGAALRFDNEDYLTISHLQIINNEEGGISAGGYSGGLEDGIIIEDCTITGNGSSEASRSQGIWFNGHDITIRRCTIGNNSGLAEGGYSHNLYMDAAVTLVTIEDSLIYGQQEGHGVLIKSIAANITRCWIYSSNRAGVRFSQNTSAATYKIWACLISGNGDAGIIEQSSGANIDLYVFNNSLFKNGTNGNSSTWHNDVLIYEDLNLFNMKNNIIHADTDAPGVSIVVSQSNEDIDYNYVYGPSGNPVYYDGATRTWNYWTTTAGFDTNGANADPLYINPPSDMSLQLTSSCIDAGDDLGSSYDDILDPRSSWPDSVATGLQGDYGIGWEIGAYFYIRRAITIITE